MTATLLDLFCGAGGAAMGYFRGARALGIDLHIVGVDLVPQTHYPFAFIQAEALDVLVEVAAGRWRFDYLHASPPCQAYTDLQKQNKREYPDLIDPVRNLLRESGRPYVIENVEGAPLRDPITLCGTMFPLVRVHRHRLFESNAPLRQPRHAKEHPLVHTHDKRKHHYGATDEWTEFVQVTGGGNCSVAAALDAMGIDWPMTKHEVNEAIPPAYTQFIAHQLLEGGDRTSGPTPLHKSSPCTKEAA